MTPGKIRTFHTNTGVCQYVVYTLAIVYMFFFQSTHWGKVETVKRKTLNIARRVFFANVSVTHVGFLTP